MKQDYKKILQIHGYKITPARLDILSLFSEGCNPMNAEEIYAKLKKRKEDIDLVTIYRTLGSFEKKGLFRKVDLQKGSAYFELNKDHHHHIICTKCDMVNEFKMPDDKELIKSILRQTKNFKSVSAHNFDLFGLCNTCIK